MPDQTFDRCIFIVWSTCFSLNKDIFWYEMWVNFLLDEMNTHSKTLGTRIRFGQLIQVPKWMCPTGPGGHGGRGCG